MLRLAFSEMLQIAGTTIDCSTTTWRRPGHRMRWLWTRSTSCGFPSSSSPTPRRTRPPWAPRTPRSPSQGGFLIYKYVVQLYFGALGGSACLHADENDNYLLLLNINQPQAMKTNSVKSSKTTGCVFQCNQPRTFKMVLNQQTKEIL